jgi:RNA polymerase sigma-70 factor (ECF subfamily)
MSLDVTPAEATAGALGDERADRVAELTELSPLIFRIGLSIGRNRSFAEDVVQETMVKAWSSLATFRGEAPFRVWVVRIANNTAISMLRRQRDQPTDPVLMTELEAGAAHPHRQAEGRAMLDDLWAALDGLDPLSRSIVVLRELEGMSYEDIGEALELPLPTVKTRLFRARRELSKKLEAWR